MTANTDVAAGPTSDFLKIPKADASCLDGKRRALASGFEAANFDKRIAVTVCVANEASTDWRRLPSRFFGVFACAFCVLGLLGCKTDEAAQSRINEMRAEQIAIEDRYVALRNDYEKMRRRLAAKGDPLAQQSSPASALPLVYPPGSTGLDPMDHHLLQQGGMDPAAPSDHPALDLPPAVENFDNPRGTDSVLEALPKQENSGTRTPNGRLNLVSSRTAGLELSNGPVSRIRISSEGSYGIDRDNMAGDDGLRILLQPLDEQGRLVLRAGNITLRVLDTTVVGPESQIGFWNFPADAINVFVGNRRGVVDGIPLQISFSKKTPTAWQLLAEVKYTTAEGQIFESREIIGLNLEPGQSWVGKRLPEGSQGLAEFSHLYGVDHSGNSTQGRSFSATAPNRLPGITEQAFPNAAGGKAANAFQTPVGNVGWQPNR